MYSRVPKAVAAILLSGISMVAQGQPRFCGDPPPVQDESLKGEISGKAQFLSRFLGDAALSGQIETARNEIFSKYPYGERANAYFQYQVCILLMQDTSMSTVQKLEELKKIQREFMEPPPPPPPPPAHVTGWIATFSTKEQGGGSFRQFRPRMCVVNTPAAIDIRSFLSANLSSGNVFISMTAATIHQVTEAGKWVYYLKITGAAASTQCMTFEVQSDGVPIGGGAVPILKGESSSTDTSAGVEQSQGMHTLSIKLACYFQGRQFPVVSFTLKPPSGQRRPPTEGDFTVAKPEPSDKPPSALHDAACVEKSAL